jgi:small subunit ribosomal protein S17
MDQALGQPAVSPGEETASRGGDGRTPHRAPRKSRMGVVVSDKMQKTVVVEVQSRGRHPFYKKVVRHSRRFKAHDEGGEAHVGDRVLIIETRPLSKDKRWRVVRVLERAR